MTLDEQLTEQARSAAEHITARQRELDAARGSYQRAVRALYLDGGSMREIGQALGISHQRVHQLLDLPARTSRGPTGTPAGPACSFCDREKSAVGKLIAGPGVCICNDCVALATTAIREGIPAEDVRTVVAPAESDQRCSFCRKRAKNAGPRAVADSGASTICVECVDLCHEILAEDIGSRP